MEDNMLYCTKCGTKLYKKHLEHEGMVPFCEKCNEYRFPFFNAAVSTVILNKEKNKTLFVKQYGKDRFILVAGYIMKGENAEEALYREMMEEIGVRPIEIRFQKSSYWEKSNTILFNYVTILDNMEITPNYEIDSYEWIDIDEALEKVHKGGLAEEFYNYFYNFTKNVL